MDKIEFDICSIEEHDLEAIRVLAKDDFSNGKFYEEAFEIILKYVKDPSAAEKALERIIK